MSLSSDVLVEILRFALGTMSDWSKWQRVSKQWRGCCRKPRTLEFVTAHLDDLRRLGPLCGMLRSVEHVVSTIEHLTTQTDMHVLRTLPHLESLFVNARLVDWSRVADIAKLRKLHIWNSSQSLNELFLPGRCAALRDLEIHHCPRFSERNLSQIQNLQRLKRLSVQHTTIRSSHLETFSHLPRLRHLELVDCGIRSLRWLEHLTQLRTLSLNGSRFQSDLEPLCGLIHLRTLKLDGCWLPYFNEGRNQLEHLRSMWQLEVFSASEWFTEEGLELLMQWRRLKRVSLLKCKFDPVAKKKFIGWCTTHKVTYEF
jgi:hypothetical protein